MHHFRLSVMNMQKKKINISNGFGVEKLSGGRDRGYALDLMQSGRFLINLPA